MKQQLRLLMTLLLCAALGQAWATQTEAYTFTTVKNTSNQTYASNYEVTIGNMNWSVPGNQYDDGQLRLGGKNFEGDRTIIGLSPFTDAITQITVNHGGISSNNITVNSVTVTVASDAGFNNIIETVVVNPSIAKNTDGTFDISPKASNWPENSYFKIAFNFKCTDTSSNRFLLIKSIVFYKESTGPIDPTVSLTTTDIKVGETTSISFPKNLSVIFESDKTSVATVSDNGVITGTGEGTATITMMWDGDDNFNEGGTEFTVKVSKNDATVTLSTTTLKVGKTATISYPNDLTIIFDSDDEDLATVNENGVITAVGAGTATISAVWGDDKYNDGETTFTITVTEGSSSSMVFVPVTNADQLVAGNEYLIVSSKSNNYFAMGTKIEGSTAAWSVAVPCEDNEIVITDEEVVVLTLGGETDAWTFDTSDDMGYICMSTDGNRLDHSSLKTLSDEKMKLWTITSDFQIKNNMYGNRYIQYNSGATRFACYPNTQAAAHLYVKKGSATSDTKTASLEIERSTLAIPGMGISETTISSVPEDLVFTLSSSDGDYATVSGNKITAVKVGSATITASWEEQTVDGYVYKGGSRTFDITIIEPEDGYYDFTNLVLDYGSNVTPTNNNSEYVEEATTWKAGNVTMVADGKYRWWLADGTLRAYNPTTLTFTVPNCLITKIELSGKNLGVIACEEGDYTNGTWEGSASSVVLYRDGSDTPQIKTIKVTYEVQPQPFTLEIIPEATDGRYYYSTLSNLGPGNFIVPSNVVVSTIIVNEKRRIENTQEFNEGESLPGNGAYLVTADYPGHFIFEVSEITEPIPLLGENQLYPSIKDEITAGPEDDVEYVYYMLSLSRQNPQNSIGFYWGEVEGAAFVNEKDNKAFLAIPKTEEVSHASAILFDGNDEDDIRTIKSDIPQDGSAYTLSGVRMEGTSLPKGVYIVNGKKMVVK